MAKKEISYLQVKSVADKIALTGENPTVDRLYTLVGDIGTKQQISEHLHRWHTENDEKKASKQQKAISDDADIEKIIAERTKELKKSLSLVRATLESTEDGILMVDTDGKFVDFNKQFIQIARLPKDLLEKGDEDASLEYMFTQLEDPEELFNLIMHLRDSPEERGDMGEVRFKDGRILERYSQPHMLGDQIVGRVWSFRDVTEKRKAEEKLRLRQRAIEASTHGVAIFEYTEAQKIIYINPAFIEITGYSEDELLDVNFKFLKGGEENQAEWQGLNLAVQEQREGQGVLRCYRKNDDFYWGEIHVAPVPSMGEEVEITHYVVILNDITERKAMEEQLMHQATHDTLTDLPNRALLDDRIRQVILYASRGKTLAAILFLDLDRFKLVNDTLGHNFGDDLLRAVSNRLEENLRETDTVARIGGDEFVIILSPLLREEDAIMISEKILRSIRMPFRVGGQELNVTTSIGISCYPRDGDNANTLIRNADTAMYQAKEAGRDNFKYFTSSMNVRVAQQLRIENNLHKALSRGEFHLHYQPVINLKSWQIVGVEALLRWQHPQLGTVSPLEFIYIAEDTGLIIPIGRWALQTACEQGMKWMKMGLPPINMAVNLSARQLKQSNIVQTVREVLDKTGLPAKYLVLELTESVLMDRAEETVALLNELKSLGLHLAVDDFGTGYSSLSYLKKFPIDKLKIDRAFVHDIGKSEDDAAIILAIVAMAKSLRLTVVAEGAETKSEVDFLLKNKCDELQGYYFSKPLDAESCTRLIEENYGHSRRHISK